MLSSADAVPSSSPSSALLLYKAQGMYDIGDSNTKFLYAFDLSCLQSLYPYSFNCLLVIFPDSAQEFDELIHV